ncbi:MAG TPA: DEAD/DEAH box helicase, partial [Desulfobacterales bacterium]|nr:DEAD/DEAH box helicase [Desulfobacterales bacterium]
FLKDMAEGKRSLEFLRFPLYRYQKEGVLHLTFGERTLLADDMGLGKTVQAIGACELLRQIRNVERVLVVSPVSLKSEWEEQISKFTNLPTRVIWGSRPVRLRMYREPSFFYLSNYEQIRNDLEEINRILAPDVVILDEAQRIKNWQTKTAKAVKRLSSPYAFVLTGTPLENRIDELYSIVEFLDPQIFGPLFRFNREYYVLDEKGRAVGYKNLDSMRRRIRPIMLRRRKEEVEDQLPQRTVNNYFVTMADEQRERYDEYRERVARLVAITKRRSLTREEFEKLQKWLACMRMLCDTPFILDQNCRICPKLPELAGILEDMISSNGKKVLVFSEWERMLHLVRDLAEEMSLGFAWHTGSVPQQKRRQEIRRFKDDPDCVLFLSTDSGSVGLNLQEASAVVNLDLPWNPAKLEQRIARAWRKHQTKPVNVVNFVCEGSIEHRMLGLLAQKRQLADGVLDGQGDLGAIKMPSGRGAFLERLEVLMETDTTRVRVTG